MARPLRIHVPNTPYHLVSRGNAKQCIFEDERDHLIFLELLVQMLERFAIACLSYCLFWNHFHLLVVPGLHSVSRFMHDLNSKYCQGFNRRHGRWGHVLGGRFAGPMVDTDSYMLTALRYIAMNPVEGEQVARPEDWRWSSYRAIAGLEPAPAFLSLDRLWRALDTDDAAVGRERYLTFVNSASAPDGWDSLISTLYCGDAATARRVEPMLIPHRKNPDFPYIHRFATRPPLEQILHVPDRQSAIDEAVCVAFCQHAYTLREIGAALGRPPGTIWNWVQRGRISKASAPVRRPVPRGELAATARSTHEGQISLFE